MMTADGKAQSITITGIDVQDISVETINKARHWTFTGRREGDNQDRTATVYGRYQSALKQFMKGELGLTLEINLILGAECWVDERYEEVGVSVEASCEPVAA